MELRTHSGRGGSDGEWELGRRRNVKRNETFYWRARDLRAHGKDEWRPILSENDTAVEGFVREFRRSALESNEGKEPCPWDLAVAFRSCLRGARHEQCHRILFHAMQEGRDIVEPEAVYEDVVNMVLEHREGVAVVQARVRRALTNLQKGEAGVQWFGTRFGKIVAESMSVGVVYCRSTWGR